MHKIILVLFFCAAFSTPKDLANKNLFIDTDITIEQTQKEVVHTFNQVSIASTGSLTINNPLKIRSARAVICATKDIVIHGKIIAKDITVELIARGVFLEGAVISTKGLIASTTCGDIKINHSSIQSQHYIKLGNIDYSNNLFLDEYSKISVGKLNGNIKLLGNICKLHGFIKAAVGKVDLLCKSDLLTYGLVVNTKSGFNMGQLTFAFETGDIFLFSPYLPLKQISPKASQTSPEVNLYTKTIGHKFKLAGKNILRFLQENHVSIISKTVIELSTNINLANENINPHSILEFDAPNICLMKSIHGGSIKLSSSDPNKQALIFLKNDGSGSTTSFTPEKLILANANLTAFAHQLDYTKSVIAIHSKLLLNNIGSIISITNHNSHLGFLFEPIDHEYTYELVNAKSLMHDSFAKRATHLTLTNCTMEYDEWICLPMLSTLQLKHSFVNLILIKQLHLVRNEFSVVKLINGVNSRFCVHKYIAIGSNAAFDDLIPYSKDLTVIDMHSSQYQFLSLDKTESLSAIGSRINLVSFTKLQTIKNIDSWISIATDAPSHMLIQDYYILRSDPKHEPLLPFAKRVAIANVNMCPKTHVGLPKLENLMVINSNINVLDTGNISTITSHNSFIFFKHIAADFRLKKYVVTKLLSPKDKILSHCHSLTIKDVMIEKAYAIDLPVTHTLILNNAVIRIRSYNALKHFTRIKSPLLLQSINHALFLETYSLQDVSDVDKDILAIRALKVVVKNINMQKDTTLWLHFANCIHAINSNINIEYFNPDFNIIVEKATVTQV